MVASRPTTNVFFREEMACIQHIGSKTAQDSISELLFGYDDPKGKKPLKEMSPAQTQMDTFWHRPTVPATDSDEGMKLNRVMTNLRMNLKQPSTTLELDSQEFKQHHKDLKKDVKRLEKLTKFHSHRRSKSPERVAEEERNAVEELEQMKAQLRNQSLDRGHEFLLEFLRRHFPDHVDQCHPNRTRTMEYIRMLGNEERQKGIKLCRKLFTHCPVIYDAAATLLWEELSQPDSFENDKQDSASEDEAYQAFISPEEIRQMKAYDMAQQSPEFIAMRESLVSQEAANVPGPFKSQQDHSVPLNKSSSSSNERPRIRTYSERRSLDVVDFLDEVKRIAVRGGARFTASLAVGYGAY